jgi:hypothetical protein
VDGADSVSDYLNFGRYGGDSGSVADLKCSRRTASGLEVQED